MAATFTERWEDERLVQDVSGQWTAQRGFDVVGYVNELDALAATGVTGGQLHPRCSGLYCSRLELRENKLTLAKVIATYGVIPLLATNQNPLLQPEVITWKWGKVSAQVDTDISGNPKLNSAGDAFRQNSSRQFSVRYLTITRWEPFYNSALAAQYTDTVNSDSLTAAGVSVSPGQMYCLGIQPTKAYNVGAPYVQIAYAFEIRTPMGTGMTSLQKRHPFQDRRIDQGTRCTYTDPTAGKTLGQLYLAAAEPANRDVLLNGAGIPIDTNIKVTKGLLAPVAPTFSPPLVDSATAGVKWLIYMDYPEMSFGSIGV